MLLLAGRLAFVLLLLTVLLAGSPAASGELRRRDGMARWTWTWGCLLLWIHVGLAFHFVHDWSHVAAYRATAEQTEAVVGWYWGGGVYVNYFTLLLWTGDVVVWWRAPRPMSAALVRWRWGAWIYLLIMAFQAGVVFAPAPARWIALGVWGLFGWAVVRQANHHS
jgi:hypothetical protein